MAIALAAPSIGARGGARDRSAALAAGARRRRAGARVSTTPSPRVRPAQGQARPASAPGPRDGRSEARGEHRGDGGGGGRVHVVGDRGVDGGEADRLDEARHRYDGPVDRRRGRGERGRRRRRCSPRCRQVVRLHGGPLLMCSGSTVPHLPRRLSHKLCEFTVRRGEPAYPIGDAAVCRVLRALGDRQWGAGGGGPPECLGVGRYRIGRPPAGPIRSAAWVDLTSEQMNTAYACVRKYMIYAGSHPRVVGNAVDLRTPVRPWISEPSFVMMESAGLHMPSQPRPRGREAAGARRRPRQNRSPCPAPV